LFQCNDVVFKIPHRYFNKVFNGWIALPKAEADDFVAQKKAAPEYSRGGFSI
jgi:hypothetical protein